MYSRAQKPSTVRFSFKPAKAVKTVLVAGDFNGWQPMSMKKQTDGSFVRDVPANQRKFEYKFIVDGQWISDPDNSQWARNPYGTFNSIGRIE